MKYLTIDNYHATIEKHGIKRADLPKNLQAGWDFVKKIWDTQANPDLVYEKSDKIRSTINSYFEKLEKFIDDKSSPTKSEKKTAPKKSAPRLTPKKKATKSANRPNQNKVILDPKAEKVESFSLEHKFIQRFVNLDGKPKRRNHIRAFLGTLQKAIQEKKIRKTSKYAKEIMDIQDSLIKSHSRFKNDDQLIVQSISQNVKVKYLRILGKQIELPSVKLIKSYINLQGKVIPNQKAVNLYNRIVKAVKSEKIKQSDKYSSQIESILGRLTAFIKKNPSSGILTIETRTLNGLETIVGECACQNEFDGFGRVPDDVIMSSVDILKLTFDKLGFTGKWLQFIGNPAKNFSMMIFGQPKFGKSILAISFASYLANNFGTVLYVAREEGIDDTLQEKLANVAHPDLFVVGSLPEDLSPFDFIFFDSVNKLGLSPEDIDELRGKYPEKGFVSIFQTRKDGNFRGSQEFQHDVDIVIEVPERGYAVQFGRYNQGGNLDIFDDAEVVEVSTEE